MFQLTRGSLVSEYVVSAGAGFRGAAPAEGEAYSDTASESVSTCRYVFMVVYDVV